jgi:hypothetical protein
MVQDVDVVIDDLADRGPAPVPALDAAPHEADGR